MKQAHSPTDPPFDELTRLRRRVEELEQSEKIWRRTEEALRKSETTLKEKQDITDSGEAEKALLRERTRFQTLLEQAPFGIVMAERDGTFTYINSRFSELFGWDLEEIPDGRTWFRKAYPDEAARKKVIAAWIEDTEDGGPGEKQFRTFTATCKDGTERIIHFAAVRLGTGEVMTTCEDITDRAVAEARLNEQFHFLQTLIDTVPSPIFYKDTQGRYLGYNKAFEAYHGINRGDLIGSSIFALKSSEESAFLHDSIDTELTTRVGSRSYEAQLAHSDGTMHTLINTKATFTKPDGTIGGVVGTTVDITERKRMEEALRESENKYRDIVENAVEGIYQSTPEGRFAMANPAFVRMLGYESEAELIASVRDIKSQFYADPATRSHYQRALETGGELKDMEYEVRRKDGATRWVLGNARAVRGSQGDILYYEGTIIDVTERKQAEEALLTERQRFQTLVDQAPFGIAMIDDEGKFTYVNPKIEEILGYTTDDIPDTETWFRLAFADAKERQSARAAWFNDTRGRKTGQRKPRVRTIICKDGRKKVVNIIPVKLETGGYFISCVDMTEYKKLETELQQALKMEAIGQLAGGVAHDFNNILTVISGYAGIINMRLNANDPYRNHVKQILSSSEKAATLVQSLLAFSRKQLINPKPLSLNETIARIEKFLLRLINEDVALKTILCDEDLIIMADSGHLDQVFMNLAANARDAMPQGGTITISTTVTAIGEEQGSIHGQMRPGPYALIAVADTGTGMDEKTKERIFEPFFTTKEAGKGTGLGLSTVYGIIKQHNGHIDVHSKPGKGTIFSIYLPVVNKDIERKAPVPIMTAPRGKGETVLVAEDQEQVRRLMTTMLESYGYKVLQAVDGEDAVRLFMANKDVDLLVLDAVMPKKNGKQVYDKVKRLRPDTKVLFVSGYAGDVIQQKGLFEEKLNFLSKPVLPNTLLQKIRDILDG